MRHYPTGFKRYERVHPQAILDFVQSELDKGNEQALGELASLSMYDLSRQTTYLITRDGEDVGFACVKFENNFRDCWLTYIYVSPQHRRTGCAKYAIRGLKVNRCNVPSKYDQVRVLLNRLGFTPMTIQRFPNHLVELENINVATVRGSREKSSH